MGDYRTALGYYEQLPDGWASFPDCVANASLLAAQRARGGIDGLFDDAPKPLRELTAYLTPNARWIPEVVHVAIVLGLRDSRFGPGPEEDEAFLVWLAKVNREILDAPGVVASIAAIGPTTVLPYLPVLWNEFHVGCALTIEHAEATRALLVVAHPTAIFHRINIETHRRTLAVALAKAGAAQLEIDARTIANGALARTELECRWR